MSKATLTVWHHNKVDQKDEIPLVELCDRFLASEYNEYLWPLERSVSVFLMTEHLAWEDRAEFDLLCDMIFDARQSIKGESK